MDFFNDLTMSDQDFREMVAFIQKNYGIDLSKKKTLITSRLSHALKEQGFTSMRPFLERLFSKKNPADLELVLNKLTTNYTYFLREREHFDFLQSRVFPELAERHKRDHTLSIWSAGCSSGEEPYTLSIYLKEYFGSKGNWDTRILATDISHQALAKAEAGVYDMPADMPQEWLRRYFTKDKTTGLYKVSQSLRQNVIFRPFNLMEPMHFRRKFDVIFCRNVMIYFDQSTRDALVSRFCDVLEPKGYFFISHSESLGQNPRFQLLAPSIYQKK